MSSNVRRSARDRKVHQVTTFDSTGNILKRQSSSSGLNDDDDLSSNSDEEEDVGEVDDRATKEMEESDDDSFDLPDLGKKKGGNPKSRSSVPGKTKKRTMKDVGDAEDGITATVTAKKKNATKTAHHLNRSENYIFSKFFTNSTPSITQHTHTHTNHNKFPDSLNSLLSKINIYSAVRDRCYKR
jgi:hypothetical protein